MENNINIALIESFIKENNLTYFDFCKICQMRSSASFLGSKLSMIISLLNASLF